MLLRERNLSLIELEHENKCSDLPNAGDKKTMNLRCDQTLRMANGFMLLMVLCQALYGTETFDALVLSQIEGNIRNVAMSG